MRTATLLLDVPATGVAGAGVRAIIIQPLL